MGVWQAGRGGGDNRRRKACLVITGLVQVIPTMLNAVHFRIEMAGTGPSMTQGVIPDEA